MKGFGLTDIGIRRAENQDCFALRFLDDRTVLCVVCDGMGGASGGSVASAIAREEFVSEAVGALEAQPGAELGPIALSAAARANRSVYERSLAEPALRGMGTTLVAAIIRGDETLVINIGDSRAYLTGARKIKRVTKDHSVVEELLDKGNITPEEAMRHPNKNLITRALGVAAEVKADVYTPKLSPGDMLFICSDGLTNLVAEQELRSKYKESRKSPEQFCRLLVALALERGAPDNVTVVALQK